MAEIPLSKGLAAIVDDEDHEWLSQWRWHARECGAGRYYAVRNRVPQDGEGPPGIYMHREILGCEAGRQVDHASGDSLDNRRSNLRPADRSQNNANRRLSSRNKTGLRGVSLNSASGKFVAQIQVGGKNRGLGYFTDATVAARAYNEAAVAAFGDFASINHGI